MPVSGEPVSAKPSVKRVVAFQNAAVPRYASRNRCGRGLVLGDDRRGEAGRLAVRERDRLVERLDDAHRDRRDALGVVRPLVPDRARARARRSRAARARRRARTLGRAVDEQQIEAVADAEPVEARLDERAAPSRGRRPPRYRGHRRPRRGRASGPRAARPPARAPRSSRRCRAGSRAAGRCGSETRIRAPSRSAERTRPTAAGGSPASVERRPEHLVDEHRDRPERRAARAEHRGVQATSAAGRRRRRDVRPRLEVRADRADRDPAHRDAAGRCRAPSVLVALERRQRRELRELRGERVDARRRRAGAGRARLRRGPSPPRRPRRSPRRSRRAARRRAPPRARARA